MSEESSERSDLKELIIESFWEAWAAWEAAHASRNKEEPEKEAMDMDEAVKYLNRKGLRVSKSSVYKSTATGEIPFRRPTGRKKLVFLTSELDEYIAGQLGERLPDRTIEKAMAASARRKMV